MKKNAIVILCCIIPAIALGQIKKSTEKVLSNLDGALEYTSKSRSFSPFYSDIGLGFSKKNLGVQELYFHYNRRTCVIKGFLRVGGDTAMNDYGALLVKQSMGKQKSSTAFYAHNSWLTQIEGVEELDFSLKGNKALNTSWVEYESDSSIVFYGYMPTKDKRDPDYLFPIQIGIKALKGKIIKDDNGDYRLKSNYGNLVLAFTAKALDVNLREILSNLNQAPMSISEAEELSKMWFQKGMGDLSLNANNEKEFAVLSKAVGAMVFNSTESVGNFAGRVSQFPSRGGYPTHFLWDAMFHNLALDYMEPRLSEDAIMLLLENLREDGMMAHFLCSTWMRPKASQPPLVGWAAWRLYQQRKSVAFVRQALPLLKKNTRWWLTQRMTEHGIIYCPDPMETGWDNTPRLDSGTIMATDMNAYILMQINTCRDFAKAIGDIDTYQEYSKLSNSFAQNMVKHLYNAEKNIFLDKRMDGQWVNVKTPASFLPLLCDLPLPQEKVSAMLNDYLFDTEVFWTDFPFPMVAKDEPTFTETKMWRGPTWLAPSYLVIDMLSKRGYHDKANEARKKIYDMVINDQRLSEYFNPVTGKGLGHEQQGWTAAILLKLHMELVD